MADAPQTAQSADPDAPQLYLITPPVLDPATFGESLARVLDREPIACLRVELATSSEDDLMRAADACREVAHARDVACVITDHVLLAERTGLDGVHLSDGTRHVRAARKALGADAIVGAFAGASRHEGMTAGEAGADYVSFGPAGPVALGLGERAEPALFAWWSEMIEVPVVAEGGLDEATIRQLAPVTDFIALGEEIWQAEDPVEALTRLAAAARG